MVPLRSLGIGVAALKSFSRRAFSLTLMIVILGGVALALWGIALVSVPAYAQGSLVLYDDFSAPDIDPAKWAGGEFGGVGREAVRLSSNGQLHLAYRSYGFTNSDTGTSGGFLTLNFINPAAVTTIRATVRVNGIQSTGCTTLGSATTTARAEIHGRFFNTGTPVDGSSVGDVFAHIQISRFSTDTVLRVLADVGQCIDAPCSQATLLGTRNLGVISLGTPADLLLQWDQPNHQFVFQRDNGQPALVQYGDVVSDTAPPSQQFKLLDINNFVANCTATPRPEGFVDAFFENVRVNP